MTPTTMTPGLDFKAAPATCKRGSNRDPGRFPAIPEPIKKPDLPSGCVAFAP